MGRWYNGYGEALGNNTECQFTLPFAIEFPEIVFPPAFSFPDFDIPEITIPFYCPLDSVD